MKKFALIALTGAALFAGVGTASAQYYYGGPGYGPHLEPRYEDRYYDRRRYRNYSRGEYEGRGIFRDSSGGIGCVQRGYTLQDGRCRPYSGR